MCKAEILRLIYQGRFLHGNVTLGGKYIIYSVQFLLDCGSFIYNNFYFLLFLLHPSFISGLVTDRTLFEAYYESQKNLNEVY